MTNACVLDHSVSKLDKICTNTQTLANAGTLTHAAGCIQRTQRHWSIRSRRRSVGRQRQWRAAPPRGQFVFPNSAIICDSLTAITLTHRTKRTKHALNARHRAAACNASIMRGSPRVTPHFPCTARAPAVWIGRTCKRSRDGTLCCQCACKQHQG